MCANVDSLGIVVCGMVFRIQALTHIQTVIHTVLLEGEKENFVDFVGSKSWGQTGDLLYRDDYKVSVLKKWLMNTQGMYFSVHTIWSVSLTMNQMAGHDIIWEGYNLMSV